MGNKIGTSPYSIPDSEPSEYKIPGSQDNTCKPKFAFSNNSIRKRSKEEQESLGLNDQNFTALKKNKS